MMSESRLDRTGVDAELKKMDLELSDVSNEEREKIAAKLTRHTQDGIIRLVKTRKDLINGGFDELLTDKIDATSYTGWSLTNWFASLFNPTEERLRKAVFDMKDLNRSVGY